MDLLLKQILGQQFGATIQMLANAIAACPDPLWNTESKFWYWSYHTLFYLDYYSSLAPDEFLPPAPFTLSEFDSSGALPDRVYSKAELLIYLEFGRKKALDLIANLTPAIAEKRFINVARNYSILEMLVYNMRHVQHHTAQLNLLLRQDDAVVPGWVSQVDLIPNKF